MMMLACDLLQEGLDLAGDSLREALEGNLCRCTGYQNIVQSIEHAAKKMQKVG